MSRRPLFLLAPGAGAPSTSPFLEAWAQRLARLGRVVRFDYPYRLAGRRAPDRLPVLIAAHREALAAHRTAGERVFLVGKSMGSRVGCHVALEEPVDGLIALGYPLVSPGRAKTERSAVLEALRTPILFVQGTRDPLAPLDRLETVRGRMTARSALHVVATGDHSLAITKAHTRATGEGQEQADEQAMAAVAAFVASVLAG